MKKLFLLFMVLLPIATFSQVKKTGARKPAAKTMAPKVVKEATPSFTTPSFIFDSFGGLATADGKEYVVYELRGWKQSELYNKMVVGISKLFTYPEKVMTKVDNELITINGFERNAFTWGGNYSVSYYYTLKFQFKDGKIRVDPTIRGYDHYRDGCSPVYGWMKTQGNYQEVKPKFENAINNLIYLFLQKSFDKKNDDW